MKKHILGLAIFSLIVGAAVIVSAVFCARKAPAPKVEYKYEVSKRICNYNRYKSVPKESGISVVQAVYDDQTKMLNIDFEVQKGTDLPESFDATLSVTSRNNGLVRIIKLSPDFTGELGKQSVSLPIKKGSAAKNMFVSVRLGSVYEPMNYDPSAELKLVPVIFKER